MRGRSTGLFLTELALLRDTDLEKEGYYAAEQRLRTDKKRKNRKMVSQAFLIFASAT